MNSRIHFESWSVRACAMAAVMAAVLFSVGCGTSGSTVPPLSGNYTNASLKGQYVIALTGIGVDQQSTGVAPFSETIVLTADGSGHLNVTNDDFDQVGGPFGGPENLAGTYSISADGTGILQFNQSNYPITMIDDSHFYLIEQDIFATGSGFGEKQDTTAFAAAPSGNFVFKAHNLQTSSRVGGINITGGNITGTEDLLNFGFLATNSAIASVGAMSAPDATNGRGQFVLSDGTQFNYYVISANKFLILSFLPGSLEIGQAEMQTGGPFSVGTLANGSSYVLGSSGDTGFALAVHSGGVFTTDGAGNVTAGTLDFVQDATVNSDIAVLGGSTYTLASSGRGVLTLSLSGALTNPRIFWMVSPAKAYFLVNSGSAVEDGIFNLQTGAPFSSLSNQAAFFMDGTDTTYKDRVGVFQPTTGSNFNWNQQANAFDPNTGGLLTVLATNGSATVAANGRVTVTVNGVTNSLVFYLSGPNTGVMVQEDANIGGAFSQQAGQ